MVAGTQDPHAPLDLSQCENEPVHIPGAIQPHGALFVVDPVHLKFTCVSDNIEAILGLAPADLLGRAVTSVAHVGGWSQLVQNLGLSDVAEHGAFKLQLGSGAKVIAVAHRHHNRLIVECEPETNESGFEQAYLYNRVRSSIVRLRETSSLHDLCSRTAREMRALTGFDRVLVYAFKEDWSGEVVAEACSPGSERYLGLRFPASDIPKQARALYTSCRLRMVPTSLYDPAALVCLHKDEVVDLTHATLRSVSPVHLRYMRNMGVTASLGISLIHEGQLWGLITCNHESGERFIPEQARSACALVGDLVSSLIGQQKGLWESEQRVTFLRTQVQIIQFVSQDRDIFHGLTRHKPSLLDVIPSTGAAIFYDHQVQSVGLVPSSGAITQLVAWLEQQGAPTIVLESLPGRYPPAHEWRAVGCGLTATRIAFGSSSLVRKQSWLLWFRPEVAQTVSWGGDPSKPAISSDGSGQLHPRTSFNLWKEDVHLKSAPFRTEEVAAAESLAEALRDEILDIEVSRQVSENARLVADANRQLVQQIEETQRIEVELRRSQKLEAVGRLAAGIAHEINTPLQFVSDSIYFLQGASSDLIALVSGLNLSPAAREAADFDYLEVEMAKALARSVEGLERVSLIVKAMKEFAQPDTAEKTLADINRAIATTVEVAQGELRGVANVSLDLGALPMISCYPGDLNQVFLNLLVNAAHAIEGTLRATRERGSISIRSWYAAPDVWVSITDDGTGIPEGIRESIFLPFFTTKEVGRGTGQGLAISHAIVVNKHGGALSFESEVGRGTTFTVRLPAPLPSAERSDGGSARV